MKKIIFLITLLALLPSCWKNPEYDDADGLALTLMRYKRSKSDIRARLYHINNNIHSTIERHYIPPGSFVDTNKIKISTEKRKGRLGEASAYYTFLNNLPHLVVHCELNCNVPRYKHHDDFWEGLLWTRTLNLWDDMEFNSTLVHELSHHYFAQRYPYIWSRYNKDIKNTEFQIIEGHAVWFEKNWLNIHYKYPSNYFLETRPSSYNRAYDFFSQNYVLYKIFDRKSSTFRHMISWEKLDNYEKSLAQKYKVKTLDARYEE